MPHSNSNKTGNDESNSTKAKFDAVWREIEVACDRHYEIGLTVAANITGFCLFPVGWAWTEFPLGRYKNSAPYYNNAEKLGRLNIRIEDEQTKLGFKAFRSAAQARRTMVEDQLTQLIRTQAIRSHIERLDGFVKPLPDEVRLHPSFVLDIKRRRIGFEDLRWPFMIFSKDLLIALESKRAWKRNSTPHDWLKMERFAREVIETLGWPENRSDLQRKVSEWAGQNSISGKEPAVSTVNDMIARLAREYSFSEK